MHTIRIGKDIFQAQTPGEWHFFSEKIMIMDDIISEQNNKVVA